MVRRVAIGALPGGGSGLRVSRPGFDVLDTGLAPNQVSLDSRRLRAEQVFTSGVVTLTAAGGVSYHTVGFGVVMPAPPTVLFMWRPANSSYWSLPGSFSGTWQGGGGTAYELMYVFNDRIEIAHPLAGVDRIVSYIILRP